MKNYRLGKFAVIFIIIFAALLSCTKTPMDGGDKLIFPELKKESVEVGKEYTINFTAADKWSLNTNQTWIEFKDGNSWFSSILGTKGEQSVIFRVLSTEQTLDLTSADIELTIGEESKVIYTAVRPASDANFEFYLISSDDGSFLEEIYDLENNELNLTLDINPDNQIIEYLGIKSNVDWTITLPLWIDKQELPSEFVASEEIYRLKIQPEFKGYELLDELKGEIVITAKENTDITYTVGLSTDGAKKFKHLTVNLGDEFKWQSLSSNYKFNNYGLYSDPEISGLMLEQYKITITSGSNGSDAKFKHDNMFGLEYILDKDGVTRKYTGEIIAAQGLKHGGMGKQGWFVIEPFVDSETNKIYMEVYPGAQTIMKYAYTIATEPNTANDAETRYMDLLVLPYEYYNNEKGAFLNAAYISESTESSFRPAVLDKEMLRNEFLEANGEYFNIKNSYKIHSVGTVTQEGEFIKSEFSYPAEALQCGASMRTLNHTNADDKAYMDGIIERLNKIEKLAGRIKYEGFYEVIYEHPSSSLWAAMATPNGMATRDLESQDKEEIEGEGLVYIPKEYSWLDMDIDDYSVIQMNPDHRLSETEFKASKYYNEAEGALDAFLVVRPLNVEYVFNPDTGRLEEAEATEPDYYTVFRCLIKSNKVPDNFDETKPKK